MKFYLNGNKTKKELLTKIGKDRLDRIIKEAKDTFMEDPLIQNDFYIGIGMLSVEFDF